MKTTLFTLTCLLFTLLLPAQQFSDTIEGNSFFLEEAYNQQEGVIQHIFSGSKNPSDNFFEIDFTQELPIYNQTHQFSYTLPFFISSNFDGNNDMGDMLLNYRYQLINKNGLAAAPRFSIILPSGDKLNGSGNDVFGIQINLPISRRWNNEFITHINAGLTFLPNVKPGYTTNRIYKPNKEMDISTYCAGASAIYLANSYFNVMTEVLYSRTNGYEEIIVSPGVRFAIDTGDLQIVPGLAFPFYFNSWRD